MIRTIILALLLAVPALSAPASAGDDRFGRYLDSVSRCGVVGYCNTTASDMLRRGPTGGRSDPFRAQARRDYCSDDARYNGRSCRVQYAPRGAFPEMEVDVEPSPEMMVRPNPRLRFASKHARWCADKYRSYRLADNTFQPSKGARKRCDSPFD